MSLVIIYFLTPIFHFAGVAAGFARGTGVCIFFHNYDFAPVKKVCPEKLIPAGTAVAGLAASSHLREVVPKIRVPM